MRVLWITNIIFPDVCKKLNMPVPAMGGWMYSSLRALLSQSSNITLAVATIYHGTVLKQIQIGDVTYYLLPIKGNIISYHKELIPLWKKINNDYKPDIVHLHGTEYSHGLAFLNACPKVKSVVSIQGLVSVIARYYLLGIDFKDVLFNSFVFHDVFKRTTLWQNKYHFYKQGLNEKEILRKVNNIIGRTTWDQAHTWAINSKARYYYCNETLRPSFYQHQWSYDKCIPHTIFISQAGYPIKGLHQVLKALPIVLNCFPDTKLYIAGTNIIDTSTFSKKIRLTGYGRYIKKMIERNHLKESVFFIGTLNEQQICEQYLRSNLFICPSSVENSPNSLGEAQILGVPCIASYVGGIPDMMIGFERWMYRFEEIEILANKIVQIFKMSDKVDFCNPNARLRHNESSNSKELLEIYFDILNHKQ